MLKKTISAVIIMAELTKETIVQDALDMGFSHAGLVDISTLHPQTEVRDMCAANKCKEYDKNWSCPPGCGTVEECDAEMQTYDWGVLVQVTMDMEDEMDYEAWVDAAQNLRDLMVELHASLREKYDDVLALGGAGCDICSKCTYPDEPCRFPKKRMSGMEGYGLVVADVCRDNGLLYYYGTDTITYTGMFLLKNE